MCTNELYEDGKIVEKMKILENFLYEEANDLED